MKNILFIFALAISLTGCFGDNSRDGELVGQAKKITHVTPLICPNYYAIDVSLGVMQNGVGSMSSQDMWLTVDDAVDIQKMNDAVVKGALVNIKYDTPRLPICTEEHIATSFETK